MNEILNAKIRCACACVFVMFMLCCARVFVIVMLLGPTLDRSQGEKVYLLSFRGFQSSMAGVCDGIEFRAFGRAVSYLNG